MGALGLIKSRGTFPWKNNEGKQSLHELTDREREGGEEGEMDGRVREVGREENKHTGELEHGDRWSEQKRERTARQCDGIK